MIVRAAINGRKPEAVPGFKPFRTRLRIWKPYQREDRSPFEIPSIQDKIIPVQRLGES
ncbi:hypothetical protein [Rhizobium leguminosarum]|uniref:hypothetical protein n=1 Tax=Rhizobium leguminosarum TaxID=384 RepID=UPI001C94A503|nr:hypothetical protein [Rhizobium leguminosarum]MBY5347418.1 hypothetical protein [Rhizobium leguminosarum]